MNKCKGLANWKLRNGKVLHNMNNKAVVVNLEVSVSTVLKSQ